MIIRIFSLLVLLGILFGCAGKENLIVLTPYEDGTAGAISLSNQEGAVTLDQAGQAVRIRDIKTLPAGPEKVTEAEIRQTFGPALELKPEPPARFLLYFKFDSPGLTEESEATMADIIKTIREKVSEDILVVGHTDRAGNASYNQKLSLERAEVIKKTLISQGVDEQIIQTTSYGEADPLLPTPDSVAEPKNRRVEVVVR